ncbi:MAG: hypothetical protein SchgKO_21140 [Schleiferiaceae bacterium]
MIEFIKILWIPFQWAIDFTIRLMHGSLFERVVIWFLLIMLVSVVVMVISILFDHSITDRNRKRRVKAYKKLDHLVTAYIFDEEARPEHLEELKTFLRRERESANLLLKTMMDQLVNFEGELKRSLIGLYEELGLVKYTRSKLHSRRWEKVVQGVREVSAFNQTRFNPDLLEIVRHRNKFLKMEAIVALLDSRKYNSLYLIANYPQRISQWEQLIITQKLKSLPRNELPSFGRWLLSEKEDILMFGMRILRIFKQYDGLEQVEQLIHHPSPYVRNEAIITVRELLLGHLLDDLVEQFEEEPTANQVEILNTVNHLGDESHIEFALKVFEGKYPVLVKLKAGKILEQSGIPLVAKSIEDEIFINHIKEPKIEWRY